MERVARGRAVVERESEWPGEIVKRDDGRSFGNDRSYALKATPLWLRREIFQVTFL